MSVKHFEIEALSPSNAEMTIKTLTTSTQIGQCSAKPQEQCCLLPSDISLEELHSVATQNLIASTRESIARELAALRSPAPSTSSLNPLSHGKNAPLETWAKKTESCTKKKWKNQVKKPRSCSERHCDKHYEWAGPLQYHKLTHSEKRQFHCEFEECTRSFYTAQSLAVHTLTHTGKKPFICNTCSKGFTTAGNLRNHQRTHTGVKPFTCDKEGCNKSFTEYSSLKKHKLVHSGAKPFACEVCGQTFSQIGSRNVHRKRIHSRLDPIIEVSLDALSPPSYLRTTLLSPQPFNDITGKQELQPPPSISLEDSDSEDVNFTITSNQMKGTFGNVIILPENPQDYNELFLPDELQIAVPAL